MKTVSLLFAVFLAAAFPALAQTQKKPAAPAPAPKPPASTAPATKETLQDRVLAVVDEDPILESDVQRAVRLGLETPNPGEADAQFRRRVLTDLIEQRLQFHEIDRFGFQQVPVDEIEKKVAGIRARFPDDAAFQRALKEVGLDLKGLRQLVARQLLVLTYVNERLGPRVFVNPDEINRYYRDTLTPEMQKRGQPAPPLDNVRDDIRETLKQQKTTQEIARWTQELRNRADVVIYPTPQANRPLPPVVKTIRETKKDPAKKPPR